MTTSNDGTEPTFRRLVDGGLLYDAERGCIHHLNETAAVICEHLRKGMNQDDIVQWLLERYDVTPEVLRQQVRLAAATLQGTTGT